MSDEAFEQLYSRLFEDLEPADVIPIFRAAEQRSSTSKEIAEVRVEEERRGKYR